MPSLELSLPTVSGAETGVSHGDLVQAPGNHDVFKLHLSSADGASTLFEGAPAVVNWSNNGTDGAFYGYVHRVDAVYRTNQPSTASVLLVGASYPLMQPGSMTWVGIRATDVVRDIAFKFGLACDVEDHPLVLPQVTQAGRSFWQLLNSLASKLGYVLRMEGATIVFRSRKSLYAHFRPITPVVDVYTIAPKIGQFNPEMGTTLASRSVSGVDPYRGVMMAERAVLDPARGGADPLYDQLVTDVVVHSQDDAETAVEAAQEANRFTKFASIEAPGNAGIAPERVIWPTPAPDSLAGHWVVRSVRHQFDIGDKHTTRAELGADGLGDTITLPGEPITGASNPRGVLVDPHRPGALSPWVTPVLSSSPTIIGNPGRPVADFAWISPTTESRAQ